MNTPTQDRGKKFAGWGLIAIGTTMGIWVGIPASHAAPQANDPFFPWMILAMALLLYGCAFVSGEQSMMARAFLNRFRWRWGPGMLLASVYLILRGYWH